MVKLQRLKAKKMIPQASRAMAVQTSVFRTFSINHLFAGILLLILFSSCQSSGTEKASSGTSIEKEIIEEITPWSTFKGLFPQLELPSKTPTKIDPKLFSDLPRVSKEQLEFIDENELGFGFRTPVVNQFYCYGKVLETDNVVALVYIGRSEFLDDLAPLSYMLATFTKDGKLVEKVIVGGQEFLGERILEAEFQKNGVINVNKLKPIRKKDYIKHGFVDNPIVSMTKIGHIKYKVNASGKIVETKNS